MIHIPNRIEQENEVSTDEINQEESLVLEGFNAWYDYHFNEDSCPIAGIGDVIKFQCKIAWNAGVLFEMLKQINSK